MQNNKILHLVSFILVVVGGLNWGLVGLFRWDLVATLLGGPDSILTRLVYVLVGVAAVLMVISHKKDCRGCGQEMMRERPAMPPTPPNTI
jgi:uncharacterized membrane protein YuzA (DUF378 family)